VQRESWLRILRRRVGHFSVTETVNLMKLLLVVAVVVDCLREKIMQQTRFYID